MPEHLWHNAFVSTRAVIVAILDQKAFDSYLYQVFCFCSKNFIRLKGAG